MANLVLVSEAAKSSNYTEAHIRLLLRENLISGKKQRGIWLVNIKSLRAYEKKMGDAGSDKYAPKRKKRSWW